jgi:stage V sporulation protein R
MVWEYYVKSRKAADYREMIMNSLYHPPHIDIDHAKCNDGVLYLNHHFEGKPLLKDFIPNTMLGIEFLWGAPVKLETTEVVSRVAPPSRPSIPGLPPPPSDRPPKKEIKWQRVVYTMADRKITKEKL